jgi:hypothetical protein
LAAQVVTLMAYDMIDGMKQDWYEAGVWLPWGTSIVGTFFCSFMNAWSGLRTRANKCVCSGLLSVKMSPQHLV